MKAVAKRTMTLNLSDAEMSALDELSAKTELSKTAVLRQALRLYQMIHVRTERGDRMFFENDLRKAEVIVLS